LRTEENHKKVMQDYVSGEIRTGHLPKIPPATYPKLMKPVKSQNGDGLLPWEWQTGVFSLRTGSAHHFHMKIQYRPEETTKYVTRHGLASGHFGAFCVQVAVGEREQLRFPEV